MLTRLVSFVFIASSFGSVSFAQNMLTADQTGLTPNGFTAAPGGPAAIPGSISAAERIHWLMWRNLAPGMLLEDVAVAAEDTRVNSPKEYGAHWSGFGKRLGITAANYGVKSVMEVSLGSIWGEDPRYDPTEGAALGNRLGHVIKMTFFARNRDGSVRPAYARLIAFPGSSFLANTWMPDSEATGGDAAVRAGVSFLSRMADNAWREFKPRH